MAPLHPAHSLFSAKSSHRLNGPSIGHFCTTTTGKLLVVDKQGHVTDISLADILNITDDGAMWADEIRHVQQTLVPRQFRFDAISSQDSKELVFNVTIDTSPLVMADANGEFGSVFVYSVVDITNFVALQDNHNLMVESMPDLYWELDTVSKKVHFCPAYADILDCSVDELPTTEMDYEKEVLYSEDISKNGHIWQALYQGDIDSFCMEIRVRNRVKGPIWLWAKCMVAKRDKNNYPLKIIGFHRNIHDQKLAEEALRSNETRMRELILRCPVAIYQCDTDGNCYFVNEKYTEITGYTLEESTGMRWAEHIHPEDRPYFMNQWGKTARECSTFDILVRFRRKDGELRWIVTNCEEFTDKEKTFFGTVFDLTDLIRTKNELEARNNELAETLHQAEMAAKLKSEFLATVSHEIRTPLNGMIGMTEMLRDTSLDDDQQNLVRIISDCEGSLLELINDVLEMSKIEAGVLELAAEPIELRDHVKGVVEMFKHKATEKKLSIGMHVDESCPAFVEADQGKLRRVLINLVGNGLKFTKQGGISIFVSSLKQDVETRQIHLKFSVKDTGIGISDEGKSKLFKPFSQVQSNLSRQYNGAGLGLAISKKIVEAMEGYFEVESSPGVGSTFSFVVKVQFMSRTMSNQILTVAQMSKAQETAPLEKSLRILVAEDNCINQQLILRMLNKLGYQADVAENGLEAVKLVRRREYDCILMDLSMPEMSGMQATQAIRAASPRGNNRKPPFIVAVTANCIDNEKDKCLQSGMNDFISKPFKLNDLRRVLACAEKYFKDSTA